MQAVGLRVFDRGRCRHAGVCDVPQCGISHADSMYGIARNPSCGTTVGHTKIRRHYEVMAHQAAPDLATQTKYRNCYLPQSRSRNRVDHALVRIGNRVALEHHNQRPRGLTCNGNYWQAIDLGACHSYFVATRKARASGPALTIAVWSVPLKIQNGCPQASSLYCGAKAVMKTLVDGTGAFVARR